VRRHDGGEERRRLKLDTRAKWSLRELERERERGEDDAVKPRGVLSLL
jgi:hypothetical protein